MGIMKGKLDKIALDNGPKGNKKFHWGAILIVVIIISAFVIAPVIPSFMSDSVYVFGSYKGKPIEFYPGSEMERDASRFISGIPAGVSGIYLQFYYQQAFYTAFMQQAMRMAIKDRLNSSGLLISPQKGNELMRDFEGFSDNQGKFDINLYNKYSNEEKSLIKEELERSFLWSFYENSMISTPLTSTFFDWLKELANEKVTVEWVLFNESDIPLNIWKDYVKSEGSLLYPSHANIIAFSTIKEAKNVLSRLEDGDISLEDISFGHQEDIDYALRYELLDRVKDSEREKLSNFLNSNIVLQDGELSEVYSLRDGRYGFFFIQPIEEDLDLNNPEILSKVSLYMKLNSEDFYQGALEEVALNNYSKKISTLDSVSLNPGGTTLYSPDLGGLSVLAGYIPFYDAIFSLGVGEWSAPMLFADSIYVFKLKSKDKVAELNSSIVKESLKVERAQALQQDLLNPKVFKNNFYEVFYESGLVEGL